jgi:hypothetical protein
MRSLRRSALVIVAVSLLGAARTFDGDSLSSGDARAESSATPVTVEQIASTPRRTPSLG